nr:MAG TPA: hypothetical protein [Caudoviricetes sp.]
MESVLTMSEGERQFAILLFQNRREKNIDRS